MKGEKQVIMFKSSNSMIAKQDDFLGINATGECGCSSSNANCGANNFSSTGTQSASQCGANHTAKDNPTHLNNS